MRTPVVPIGVGIDTARYGHHVTLFRADLQPAAPALDCTESPAGYQKLQQLLQRLQAQTPNVHFHIRLDAAGQYAANLEAFLRSLALPITLSIGEPARNRRYREAFFPKRKADPVESQAVARYAVVEQPAATLPLPAELATLRELVSRLEGQSRQSTRLTNQLHNLLARVFPELATLVADLQAAWLLRLLAKYPTPAQLARAQLSSLTQLARRDAAKAERLQAAARGSVGSFTGPEAQRLVRLLVGQLRRSRADENDLQDAIAAAAASLPAVALLDSIKGIGLTTAALLVAKLVAIERFAGPNQVVSYFGIFPQECSSGVDKHGQPKPGPTQRMSRQGNDLVRKYLWNAAKSAISCNPAVRALYRRLRARGRRGDVALGHCMRKLLHLVFAVWKTGKPFDAKHYPWEEAKEQAAGHKQGTSPERKVVTAAVLTVTPEAAASNRAAPVDFAVLRQQVGLAQVLEQLGHLQRLRGSGAQRRGPCPLHAPGAGRGRTFSVNLDKNVFQCFHPPCAAHGNVLDLWAALKRLPLVEAAQDLAVTFGTGTEKRNP